MMDDLYEIPRSNVARQVSEFVKRVRALKIHCMICSSLSAEMPSMFGKDSKKAKLIARLEVGHVGGDRRLTRRSNGERRRGKGVEALNLER